ncbi:T9SS type A sorting domain-containing protein [Flavobacterium sp.]|uniref:T9SS type A sorting domain-containing protein n=1 Tax=Flavobacterium sp. TaxID=239 RepID=UPI002869F887|nr:T9SS type A sorting domain-containing protein [Flavobacterium sp.]
MKNLKLLLLFLCCNTIFAHTINYENQVLKHWFIEKENKFIDGSFAMIKNGEIYIEDADNNLLHFPISSFAKADQVFANQKEATVKAINTNVVGQNIEENNFKLSYKLGLIALFLLITTSILFRYSDRKKLKYLVPIMFCGVIVTLYGFGKKVFSTTDPAFMTAAFAPFTSTVSTNYDANFFYVNSTGIPNHTMMVGIASNGWQQQVPISKCYINTSHWTIPLNPVLATTPVAVSASHFTKGAIAMATNGVPIFNPYTNTGADAFLTGQLDNYGGHCGRGDDYHYHTAPLHLITLGQTTSNLPIAFGLDGYAVYGSLEPDGSAMATLDTNHGHNGSNGVYHYHGTPAAPYMIGKMVGAVTEDASLQIIPQPQGSPVRTENWGPLGGALITSCVANTSNGYNTAYTLNGTAGYATNYTATAAGAYTFQYVTPTGTTSTNYTGPAQCTVPNLGAEKFIAIEQNIKLYPNPATDILKINLGNNLLESEVQAISIYDIKGSLITKTTKFESSLDIKNLSKGTYFVKIQFSNSVVTKKLLVK